MSYRLKNRNRGIPNGITYRDGMGHQSPAHSTFTAQGDSMLRARLGNPGMARRYRLSTDRAAIDEELDAGLAQLLHDQGFDDFVISSNQERAPGGAPSPVPPHPQKKSSPNLAGLVAGAKTLAEMFGKDGPVEKDLAEKRATICLACPIHVKADGDWIAELFTGPASAAVRQMLGAIKGSRLETQYDKGLHVCHACGCPVATKIWAQLDHILKHMPQDAKDALAPGCWIKTLDGASPPPPTP